ncbi:hypothetical protein [Tsukamurella columbiensis]|uniref:DUF8175 domain-containing protein n=1 Tax=Tsukamurella columbiensis TaxID=128509 RepID=A0ABX1LLV1_9ACTN|nr:hypothetical protein [Tsukamurella columbiensis]NMD57993.1 hypothetical protein [Tsukamurella columbiensis]
MTTPQTPSPSPTGGNDENGRTRRLNWTLISGLFIAVIVIVAVVILAVPSTRPNLDGPNATGPSTTVARPPSADTGADVRSQFGTPRVDINGRRLEVPSNAVGIALPQAGGPAFTATDPEWLTGPPRGLMWQYLFNGVAMPFSTSDGPSKIVNGVPEGFARTPQGAVMAAWQLTFRLTYETDGGRRQSLLDRGTISDGSAGAADARQQLERLDGRTQSTTWAGGGGPGNVPVGVRVSEFSGEYALVSFVFGLPGDTSKGVRTDMQVVWRDGMWKLPLPALGTGATENQLDGRWSRRW